MKAILQKATAVIGVLIVIILSGTPVLAQDKSDPYLLIQQVADKTFKRISSDKAIIAQNPDHLKVIVTDELMPYIDHRYASRRILYKIKSTKADRKAFYKAFEQYLVTTYATVFSKYNDQAVTFAPALPFADKKIVEVKTKVHNDNSDDLDINFKVRKNKKTGIWKAYDLKAQGVSLLDSKRAELIGLLRQSGGVAKVTKLLEEKAKASIVVDS